MRFIQNILHLLQCRPPSASGNHRLSWSESPNWFLSMPSLALFSTIPSSGVASSMLFLRESTRWSSREGSSPVNSEAIRRLGCANEDRLRWNPDSFREESLGPYMPCVPGPRPVGRSTRRRQKSCGPTGGGSFPSLPYKLGCWSSNSGAQTPTGSFHGLRWRPKPSLILLFGSVPRLALLYPAPLLPKSGRSGGWKPEETRRKSTKIIKANLLDGEQLLIRKHNLAVSAIRKTSEKSSGTLEALQSCGCWQFLAFLEFVRLQVQVGSQNLPCAFLGHSQFFGQFSCGIHFGRRVSLDHSFRTLDISWASCSFFPLSVVIASGFLKTFYSLPYSWFIYAKKSPNFSFSSSAFMHSNNSCSEFLHSCCKNKFYIKIRYYNCKKQKSLSADVSLVTL